MDAEQYCFEDFDFEPEPSPALDQSSDWDASGDLTLKEDNHDSVKATETRTALNHLNHVKERPPKPDRVTKRGISGNTEYVKLGGGAKSAFIDAKAAQRSSWAGSRSKVFVAHGRSRSLDLEDAGEPSGAMRQQMANGFVRTGQGGIAKTKLAEETLGGRAILPNRVGGITHGQHVMKNGISEEVDLETIGEQLQTGDKFSVRTRSDVQQAKWKGSALPNKHLMRSHPHMYGSGQKLVHSKSVDSPIHPGLQSPIRPAGLIDKKDRHHVTLHAQLHSQRSLDHFGPVLQNRLPHQMKGQSLDNLPSASERIKLFGPKDLISNIKNRGTPVEFDSKTSSSTDLASSGDSGVSVSTTAESLESIDPDIAKQLLVDIPPASLTPVTAKLKRKPIVLPADNPNLLDKVLGLPPSGRQVPAAGDKMTTSDGLEGGTDIRGRSCHRLVAS